MEKRIGLALILWAASVPAQAALFTVGPTGTHRTIQAGFDAALGASGPAHELRIASGTFYEHVEANTWRGSQVLVSGGWNATFTARTGSTTLDGDGRGRALELYTADGSRLTVRSLIVRNGYLETVPHSTSSTYGAGIRASAEGASTIELSSLVVRDNWIQAAIPELSSPRGAGLAASASGSARIRVVSSTFESNRIGHGVSSPSTASGAGAAIAVQGNARVDVLGSTFRGNVAAGTYFMGAGGLAVESHSPTAIATVEDNHIESNEVVGDSDDDPAAGGLVLAASGASSRITVTARRNWLVGNRGPAQVHMWSRGGVGILISDSLVAGGSKHGVVGAPTNGGAVGVFSSTIVANPGAGVLMRVHTTPCYVYNSIVYGNGVNLDLPASVLRGSNLVGVDPMFQPGSLYQLQPGSPARDTGTNTPPAGLGPLDLVRASRVVGPRVDIGAWEWR